MTSFIEIEISYIVIKKKLLEMMQQTFRFHLQIESETHHYFNLIFNYCIHTISIITLMFA